LLFELGVLLANLHQLGQFVVALLQQHVDIGPAAGHGMLEIDQALYRVMKYSRTMAMMPKKITSFMKGTPEAAVVAGKILLSRIILAASSDMRPAVSRKWMGNAGT
jgi:hypothetical protein